MARIAVQEIIYKNTSQYDRVSTELDSYNPPYIKNAQQEIKAMLDSDPAIIDNPFKIDDRIQKVQFNYLRSQDIKVQLINYTAIHICASEFVGTKKLAAKRMLEFGANWGPYPYYLKFQFKAPNIFGLDIDRLVVNYAQNHGLKFGLGNVCNIPFDENYFDIILSRFTLEAAHLYNLNNKFSLNKAFSEINRALKPGGLFIFEEGLMDFDIYRAMTGQAVFKHRYKMVFLLASKYPANIVNVLQK